MTNFRFDTISFFIGLVTATLIWWTINLLAPFIKNGLDTVRAKRKELSQKNISDIQNTYLKAIYKQTQSMHLAASLFPLDEIIETPQLLAPPAIIEPNEIRPHQDIIEQTIPYLIDYPEIGAFYNAQTLSIPQAFSGGTNLVIVGQPGIGKSTALAYLASKISQSALPEKVFNGFFPFLIHVADLGLPLNNPQKPQDFLAPIITRITQFMGLFETSRIPKFVEIAFSSGQALLLLDGMDELPQPDIQEVSSYLRVILRLYPKTRVIATGGMEYLDGLLSLGFTPLALMPWDNKKRSHFLTNWSNLWGTHVATESWNQRSIEPLDPILLNRWLAADNSLLSPLEFTLKIWGAYAGDLLSAQPNNLIEAHIKRISPPGISSDAICMLAAQACQNEIPFFDGRLATEWTKAFTSSDLAADGNNGDPTELEPSNEKNLDKITDSQELAQKNPKRVPSQSTQHATSGLIPKLISSGLLTTHPGNKLRFLHPIFLGYLAGKGFGTLNINSAALLKQPAWTGQATTLRFFAVFGDASALVHALLSKEDPILFRPKFTAARLIKDAGLQTTTDWRNVVMTSLLDVLQGELNPLGLRAEAMASLVLCGDKEISPLFRQLLLSPSNELRQLAALGSGILKDAKAVDSLIQIVANALEPARRAACLALVEIGTARALESVATYLMRGDELLRVYSAEALANHLPDGQEALREGLSSDDILVRRAIVFGLSRIQDHWATELLEKTQLNDEQWAVRNVAVEMLHSRQVPNPHIPRVLLPPYNQPWLIELAGKYGMGVSPGQPATNILLLALKDSNRNYFQPALTYLCNTPSDDVLSAMYQHLYGSDIEIKEAVFQALKYMSIGGTSLPNPQKFGFN